MKLQELIDTVESVYEEKRRAVESAELDVKQYLHSQTVTVQELYNVVGAMDDDLDRSGGQVSTWQILDIAKRVILNRKENE